MSRRVFVLPLPTSLLSLLVAGSALWGCSKADNEAAAPASEAVPSKAEPSGGLSETAAAEATAEASVDSRTDPPPGVPGLKGPARRGDADELGAVALPSGADCVRKCVEHNQMRAVGSEQVVADCRRSCRSSCTQRCEAEAVGRPAHFEAECRKDCSRQVGGPQP